MKKLSALLASVLFALSLVLPARAVEGTAQVDLSALIVNPVRRHYAEAMISYALAHDPAVVRAQEAGFISLFFFEGCSDNMDDSLLKDISYYRVSAVCVAVKTLADGKPGIVYFNGNCSTLPDRPLEYGKKTLADGTKAGPATILDGTYEIYSVKHNGAYEALHIQTSEEDETVAAVYMTADGYANAQASQINIHTRTGNHVIEKAMWSAGCLLVGDGDFGAFTELVQSTFYASYDAYEKDLYVGTVTVDRQMLKEELYDLYQDRDGVDMLLSASRRTLPEKYRNLCQDQTLWEETQEKMALAQTQIMTLPCSPETDVRSVPTRTLAEGDQIHLIGTITNTRGSLWYITEVDGERGYVYAGHLGDIPQEEETEPPREPGFWGRLLEWLGG